MGDSEGTSVHPACPTTGEALCFSPKLFGCFGWCFFFFLHYLIFARFLKSLHGGTRQRVNPCFYNSQVLLLLSGMKSFAMATEHSLKQSKTILFSFGNV